MLDSPRELLDKIRLGEDSFLELKEVRFAGESVVGPHRDSLADELAAFANGRGGVCVLGVEDASKDILGIPVDRLDKVETFVRSLIQDAIKPSLIAYLERMWLPDLTGVDQAILKVEIPKSLFVHQSPGGYLHRVGSAKRVMAPEYLARLFQQRSQARLIRFDEQAVAQASLGDLDPDLYNRFRTPRTMADGADFLGKLAMARQDDDLTWRPTVSGILMATRNPRVWIPNAFIQAVAYAGTRAVPATGSAMYQLDAKDIVGPLDEQAIEACRFVQRNMRMGATKDMGREDVPQFDMTAVFEAVVNAVAHRDYSIYGAKVRLRMFQDRLEIYTPGQLSNTMSVASLPFRQAARNEALTSLLAKCEIPESLDWLRTGRRTLMDKRGEGVQIILDRSEALSGRLPAYQILDDSELVLTIYGGTNAPIQNG
jgi:predicted HTH transcriptional regulator